MSCTSCESQQPIKNKQACPYRMSDGRNFTDYRTRCTIDNEKKNKNFFKSNYEERQFLIHNAKRLMGEHETAAKHHNVTHCCYSSSQEGTMLPEKNMIQCNKKTCSFYESDPKGIGTGRNYSTV